tara:strand:- start:385 stop:588 length:204 start_codon:yes stop_codon:yes gene_type:complete
MITNHGLVHVFNFAVFSKIIQLTQTQRWQIGLSLLKRFINKLFLFICLESVLAALILFGTGYITVLK